MRLRSLAAVLVLCCAALAAKADTFFSYVSANGGTTFSFAVPTPVRVVAYSPGIEFSVIVNTTTNGAYATNQPVKFYNSSDNGGLFYSPLNQNLFGSQLYSGAESNPTFLTGPFTLYSNTAQTNVAGTLTITPSVTSAATPEPSSLALLGTGVLGVLGAVRRRMA